MMNGFLCSHCGAWTSSQQEIEDGLEVYSPIEDKSLGAAGQGFVYVQCLECGHVVPYIESEQPGQMELFA